MNQSKRRAGRPARMPGQDPGNAQRPEAKDAKSDDTDFRGINIGAGALMVGVGFLIEGAQGGASLADVAVGVGTAVSALGGIIAVSWNVRSNALAKLDAEYALERTKIQADRVALHLRIVQSMQSETLQAAAANEPPQPAEVELPADPGPPGGPAKD